MKKVEIFIKEKIDKLFSYNWILFNLSILAVFVPFIAYKYYQKFLYIDRYYSSVGEYLGRGGGSLLPAESIVVIYLIVFGLFNVIKFNKIGKKLPIYLIITIIPFLMVLVTKFIGSCLRCRTDNMIFTVTCIYLPISFSSYYIIKKEIHILLKIFLIFVSSTVIYCVGLSIGIVMGLIPFGP